MAAEEIKTRLSTKGQVILPKAIRESLGWEAGARLVVEKRSDGVMLREERATPLFPPTRIEDVRGMLKYTGPPISIEDMKRGVAEAAAERYARSLGSSDHDRD